MLRRNVACAGLIAALLALGAGQAAALNTLNITGFQWGSHTIKGIDVYNGTSWLSNRTFAAGAFTWKLDGEVKDTPLYCVDVFHSFYWGQVWQVDRIAVPPGPSNPPPYNTIEAAWIYRKYGQVANKDVSAGVQLAIWEVTHDQNWRGQALNTRGDIEWWKAAAGFDFNYRGSQTAAAYIHANAILQDLYRSFSLGGVGSATYYRPHDPSTAYFAQGQIGEGNGDSPVPEPGTWALFGVGLVGVAGAAWRRRRG